MGLFKALSKLYLKFFLKMNFWSLLFGFVNIECDDED